MKIVLNKKEIEAFKKLDNKMQEQCSRIYKALDEEEGKTATILDIFSDCKFANISLGFNGLTINIHPDFVVDFLQYYSKAIVHASNIVLATIEAINALEEDTNKLDKWF